MTWLTMFGAFMAGVFKGIIGEGSTEKLDPLVGEDKEAKRNREAKEKLNARKR